MRTLKITFMIILAMSVSACQAQTKQDKPTVADESELQVYYFHFTKRCATCNAIETETKLTLESFYKEKVNEGSITFNSVNLDEEDSKTVAGQLKVTGQALLIVKGDEVVNLTNEGFMNARTKPDKFHDILKTNIDKLL